MATDAGAELRVDVHNIEPIPEADKDSTGLQQMWIWAGANIAPINWALGALGIVRADSRPWPQSAGAAKQCRSARRDGPARECRSSAGPHLSRLHHVHHALAMCDVQRCDSPLRHFACGGWRKSNVSRRGRPTSQPWGRGGSASGPSVPRADGTVHSSPSFPVGGRYRHVALALDRCPGNLPRNRDGTGSPGFERLWTLQSPGLGERVPTS